MKCPNCGKDLEEGYDYCNIICHTEKEEREEAYKWYLRGMNDGSDVDNSGFARTWFNKIWKKDRETKR